MKEAVSKIRQKAREFHAKTRRELLGTLGVRQFPSLEQVLHTLFALAFVWSFAGLYFLNRGKWSGAMPGDRGFSRGIEFCLREIERRRDHFRPVLLWPFLTLVAVWIAGYFVMRGWQQP